MRQLLLIAGLCCLTAVQAEEPIITAVLSLHHIQAVDVLGWLSVERDGETRHLSRARAEWRDDPVATTDLARELYQRGAGRSSLAHRPGTATAKGGFERPVGLRELRAIEAVNALVANGTESSITELKQLLELLDVPRQPIQLDWFVVDLPLSSIENEELREPTAEKGYGPEIVVFANAGEFDELWQRWTTDPDAVATLLEPAVMRTDQPAIAEWREVQSPELPPGWLLDEPLTAPVKVLVDSRVTGVPGNYSVTAHFTVVLTSVYSLLASPGFAVAPMVSKNTYTSMLRLIDRSSMIIGLPIRGSGADARRSLLVVRPTVWRDSETPE